MSSKVSYEGAVKEFSRRVLERLRGRVDSVVLYGSVATGEATRESDIDVLIIAAEKEKNRVRREVLDIGYDVDYENGFETFIVPIHMSPEEVGREIKAGSYFIRDVLMQGVVLYDNGTFRRIRKESS